VLLDVGTDALEVADDGLLDGRRKVAVTLREELGVVAHVVQDGLPAVGREGVALVERDLDRVHQGRGGLGLRMLDVGEALRAREDGEGSGGESVSRGIDSDGDGARGCRRHRDNCAL